MTEILGFEGNIKPPAKCGKCGGQMAHIQDSSDRQHDHYYIFVCQACSHRVYLSKKMTNWKPLNQFIYTAI
jgi:DNA-directed RNA polymerase subunit RPC12/RpoP